MTCRVIESRVEFQLSGRWLSETLIIRIDFALPIDICLLQFYLNILWIKISPAVVKNNIYIYIYKELCINPYPAYLLTPWSRVVLEKLTVNFAAGQEISRIYGTRNSLTVPTRARHLSLSWANSIQSPRPPQISWRFILILSSYLRLGLPNGLFPSGFLTNNLCTPLSSPIRATLVVICVVLCIVCV
jgi:hypothetical protein